MLLLWLESREAYRNCFDGTLSTLFAQHMSIREEQQVPQQLEIHIEQRAVN